VVRDGNGLDQLVKNLRALSPALIVLEATGGFEVTVAAAPGTQPPTSVASRRSAGAWARMASWPKCRSSRRRCATCGRRASLRQIAAAMAAAGHAISHEGVAGVLRNGHTAP
jgi:hypothetical protein